MNQFAPRPSTSRPWLAFAVAGFVLLAGCTTDGGTQLADGPDTPPTLPATTSMEVDFGLFQIGASESTLTASTDLVELGAAFSSTQINFGTAAITVLVAQALTVLHLAVPTVVFGAAVNTTPTFESDGRWHWRYTASTAGTVWTAHLSGAVDGNSVDWNMRISAPTANPALNEFLWYSGLSRTDQTSGTWRFFDPLNPSGSNEVVRLDWSHTSNEIHGVTITVTGGDNVGDVLTADRDGTMRLVTFVDASQGTNVEISWDTATGVGYIVAPNFNGGVKACWDAGQNDVPCS